MKFLNGGNKGDDARHINTIIGEGTRLEGEITIPGSVRVDGVIKGGFFARGHLTVGAQGEIEAPTVKCESAHIAGKIVGNLIAPQRVHLTSTAKVFGDITTQVLVIEEGAVFNGRSQMTPPAEEEEKREEE